jgi:hypothetical protein
LSRNFQARRPNPPMASDAFGGQDRQALACSGIGSTLENTEGRSN